MVIRILVAHGEGLPRAGIVQLLRTAQDMQVVAQASASAQAVRMSALARADIAVLDGTSRELARRETIESIVASGADVLLLTSSQPDAGLLKALEAGAVGFLPLDSNAENLHLAVRLIAQGNGFIDPTIIRPITRVIGQRAGEDLLTDENQFTRFLTSRERQVLSLLAQGQPNAEIAQQLAVSENTVKTHVSRLLAKLGLRSRLEAALAVRDGSGRVTHTTPEVPVPDARQVAPRAHAGHR